MIVLGRHETIITPPVAASLAPAERAHFLTGTLRLEDAERIRLRHMRDTQPERIRRLNQKLGS